MAKWGAAITDIFATLIWAGGLTLVIAKADNLSGEIAIPLTVLLCVGLGFVSGRHRILLVPIGIVLLGLLVAALFGSGEDCRPSNGCEDDVAPWFWIAWTVFWLGVIEFTIWTGVLIRRATLGRPRQRPAA